MKGQIEPMQGVRIHTNMNGAVVFRLHYSADPAKTREWAAEMKRSMSDPAMYEQELEIDFGATGGALIYDYHPEATEEEDFVVPAHWTRYTALDPHPVTPHAMLWIAVDPYGMAHCYREYWPSKVYGRSGGVPEVDNRVSVPEYVKCVQFLESAENVQNGGRAEYIYRRVIDYAARAFGQGTSDDNPGAQADFQTRFERAADAIELDFRMIDAKKNNVVAYEIVNTWLRPLQMTDAVTGEIRPMSKLRIMRGRCPELIWQLRNNRRKKLTPAQSENDDPLMRAIRKRNHLTDCLVAGTLVTTARGDVAIEAVEVGDLVMTRRGWRPVTDAWKVSDEAEVFTVEMSNGISITGTSDHRVLVNKDAWICIDSLRYGDIISVCELSGSSTRDESLGDGRMRSANRTARIFSGTSIAALFTSTGSSGKKQTAQFQTVGMCTILTGTRATIAQTISKLWTLAITCELILSKTLRAVREAANDLSSTPFLKLRNGTVLSAAGSGTPSTPWRFTPSGKRLQRSARSAAASSSPSTEAMPTTPSAGLTAGLNGDVNPGSTTSIASASSARSHSVPAGTPRPSAALWNAVHVVAVRPSGKAPVYDLSVAGEHEFYANGVLVHNCAKYLCVGGLEYVDLSLHHEDTWQPASAGINY